MTTNPSSRELAAYMWSLRGLILTLWSDAPGRVVPIPRVTIVPPTSLAGPWEAL